MIREQIEEKLRVAFQPAHLEVHDESYRHNVPAGSESHVKVVIVSDCFAGQRFLARHRLIYGDLAAELAGSVRLTVVVPEHSPDLPSLKRPAGRFFCYLAKNAIPGSKKQQTC